MRSFVFVFFVFGIALISSPTFAENMDHQETLVGGLHESAPELFRQIWSPYCPGISLLECTSSQAQDLRDELNRRLKNGESPNLLLKEIYERFGSGLRMSPQIHGREALAYFLPWTIAAGVIALVLILIFKRRSSKSKLMSGSAAPIQGELEARILKDLSKRID